MSTHDHAVELREKLDALRREGRLCDAVIRVRDKDFFAHKSVLAASCQYFRSMFTSGMKESSARRVHLKGENLTAEGFGAILEYMYTGVFPKLTLENVFQVVDMANLLQYEGVINHCSDFMVRQFVENPGIQNYLSALQTAEMYGMAKLRDAATEAIKENFLAISSTTEFCEHVSKDILLNILAADDLHVRSEVNVLEAVLSWLNFDLANRLRHANELLKQVRLILIDPYQLNELSSLRSAMAVPQFKDAVKQALIQHALPIHFHVRPRGNFQKALVEFADRGGYLATNVTAHHFDWTTMDWNDISGLRLPSRCVCYIDSCVVHDNILFISLTRNVYSFNPATCQWTDLKFPMSSACASDYIDMVMHGNCLYMSLGMDIKRYNLSTGKWQFIYPLNQLLRKQGNMLLRFNNVTTFNNYLFVIGATEKKLSTYWFFDTENNEWLTSLSGSIPQYPSPGDAKKTRGQASSRSTDDERPIEDGGISSITARTIDGEICVVGRDKQDNRLCLWIGTVDADMHVSWKRATPVADRWIPLHYQDSVVPHKGKLYIITRTHWIDSGIRVSPSEKYGLDLQYSVPDNLRRLVDKSKSVFCELRLRAEHLMPSK